MVPPNRVPFAQAPEPCLICAPTRGSLALGIVPRLGCESEPAQGTAAETPALSAS
jgi:hypothetical protein